MTISERTEIQIICDFTTQEQLNSLYEIKKLIKIFTNFKYNRNANV